MNESDKTPTPKSPSPESMPGLGLAYEFVQPSYQWALSRFEAGNTRLQTLLAFIVSVSLAFPAFAVSLDATLSFADERFLLASIAFLAAMAVGIYGRHAGALALMDPGTLLLPDWLELPEAEFKHHALRWAADHFARNVCTIERKWRYASVVLVLFFVEATLLLAWALAPRSPIS